MVGDHFYQGFLTWACRARTLQGRKLVVQTILLPRLWHYTAVVVVSAERLTKWQSMVNVYIQSGNTTREVRTSSLLHAGFQYDRRVGWKSPHVVSIIAKQQIMRLQVLVQSAGSEDSTWSYLARQAFAECMGSYHRESSFD